MNSSIGLEDTLLVLKTFKRQALANFTKCRTNQIDYIKPFISLSPICSPNQVQIKPEVRKTEFNPSGLRSEPVDAIETHIVFNPDWLNTISIIAAKELLGRPMTLDDRRRWTDI